MHGMSAHHDTCFSHVESAHSTVGRPGTPGSEQDHRLPAGARPGVDQASAVVQGIAGAVPIAAALTSLKQCDHDAETCVAVLTLLLLLAPLLRRVRCRPRPYRAKGAAALTLGFGRGPPPWHAPSPFVLCQLRN